MWRMEAYRQYLQYSPKKAVHSARLLQLTLIPAGPQRRVPMFQPSCPIRSVDSGAGKKINSIYFNIIFNIVVGPRLRLL